MSEDDSTTFPSRPHRKLTDDGRTMREVLSYSRRGSRFTPRQAEAWAAHSDDWVIPESALDDFERLGRFDQQRWFGREAPLIIEIGSGVGEATAALAACRPDCDVLALEVWVPGIADSLWRAAECGAENIRFCSIDAAWFLERLIPVDSLAGLWIFFPDPWHKSRHNKRRLISPRFAAMASARLAPDAEWRLATDWAHYAQQMIEVLEAEPLLAGGVVPRWEERPVTKFERKGVAKGREITDLAYRRVR